MHGSLMSFAAARQAGKTKANQWHPWTYSIGPNFMARGYVFNPMTPKLPCGREGQIHGPKVMNFMTLKDQSSIRIAKFLQSALF